MALPKHLTESRWARCAVLSGSGAAGVPGAPWHWNPAEEFATAPGIACFNKSDAFAHGGLSIQECLTPDILVEREPGCSAGSYRIGHLGAFPLPSGRFRWSEGADRRSAPRRPRRRFGGPESETH